MSIDLEAEMRWSVWHLVSIYFLPELLLLRRSKGKEQRWVRGQRSGHDFHSGRCLKFFCFHSVESIVFFLQGMLSARICKSLDGIPLMKTNECAFVCLRSPNVCGCDDLRVFDWTDCVFLLWCVCAFIRTFAGPAAVSAGAPETASVCCSLERCKQPLYLKYSRVSFALDTVLTSPFLFPFLVFAFWGCWRR